MWIHRLLPRTCQGLCAPHRPRRRFHCKVCPTTGGTRGVEAAPQATRRRPRVYRPSTGGFSLESPPSTTSTDPLRCSCLAQARTYANLFGLPVDQRLGLIALVEAEKPRAPSQPTKTPERSPGDSLDEGQDGHAEVRLNQGVRRVFALAHSRPRGVPQRVLPKAQAPAPIPDSCPRERKRATSPSAFTPTAFMPVRNDRHRICARGPRRQQRERSLSTTGPVEPRVFGRGRPVIRDLHFQISPEM